MRLHTETIPGNLPAAVDWLNRHHAGRFLVAMQTDFEHGDRTVVVLRFDDYPSYVWYCQQLGRFPMPAKDFFA